MSKTFEYISTDDGTVHEVKAFDFDVFQGELRFEDEKGARCGAGPTGRWSGVFLTGTLDYEDEEQT